MLKYVLLGALNYLPLTGYQLKQFMDAATRHFWYAQTSQVYRTLDALEQEGLVTSEIQPQETRPDRRMYTITDTGRADVRAWLAAPMTDIDPVKDSVLLRLYFSGQLDKDTLLTHLRLQRALHQDQLALLRDQVPQQIAQSVSANPHLRRDGLMWDAVRRSGELTEEAVLRWLDETIERVTRDFDDPP